MNKINTLILHVNKNETVLFLCCDLRKITVPPILWGSAKLILPIKLTGGRIFGKSCMRSRIF